MFAKDDACNWVACGLLTGTSAASAESFDGCGRSFCFLCKKKLCGRVLNADGTPASDARTQHDAHCCAAEGDPAEYCPGGHNSHCER